MTDAHDTKRKILDCANELFGEKGFEGTSVREIAKAAGVNLAAINYHYQNKNLLYWAIYEDSYKNLENGLREISTSCDDFEECIYQMFLFMKKHGVQMKNTFKIFLSDFMDKMDFCDGRTKKCGPPGEEYILALMDKNLNKDIPMAAKIWGVHSIFTNISHNALVASTSFFKKMKMDHSLPDSETVFKIPIKMHARAIISFLNSQPEDLDKLPDFKTYRDDQIKE